MPGPRLLSDIHDEDVHITALLYGTSGVGKTVFACGSQIYRTLFIDIDRGYQAAKCWKGDAAHGIMPIRQDQITHYPVSNWQEVCEALEYADARTKEFDLVLIDTGTELQKILLQEICKREGLQVPSKREWGIVLTMMEEVCVSLREMAVHVLMTAHETAREEEYEKLVMYMPSFKGAFSTAYGRHFSLILRYCMVNKFEYDKKTGEDIRHTTRAIRCKLDPGSVAKDRSSALDDWEPPILDHIFQKFLAAAQSA